MIDICAVGAVVGLILGFCTVIGTVYLFSRSLKTDMVQMESRIKSDLDDMKADIKAIDDKQVLLQKDMTEVKAEQTVMKADMERLTSDITEMKTDIKTTDDRLRSIDRNVAGIDGFLRGRIPDFIQEPDRETTAETEQVGEVVGD